MQRIKTNLSVALGISFFTQALTPLVCGAVLFDPLVQADDISKTMTNIVGHLLNAHLAVGLDLGTAMVIILLGGLLYTILRRENRVWALTAFALYCLESVMLVMSRLSAYALIQTSNLYVSNGDALLKSLGQVFLSISDYSYKMAMVPFGIGGILFYYLLYRSRTVPTWLALWGLITAIPVLIGVPLTAYGIPVPFALMVPYVPFEFFIGVYILIRGLPNTATQDVAIPQAG